MPVTDFLAIQIDKLVTQIHPGGVLRIASERRFKDGRGVFMESRRDSTMDQILGESVHFLQTNYSWSLPFVVRGMHYQLGWPYQAKLIRCVQGGIFQVAVDARKNSRTRGTWVGSYLDADTNCHAVWVPPGFANGFMALTIGAVVAYEMTAEFNPELDRGFRWNDGDVGIKWPAGTGLNMSQKDRDAPMFKDAELWEDVATTMLKDFPRL